MFHFFDDQLRKGLHLVREGIEDEFVVDLQDHAAAQSFSLQPALDADHGQLDDVSGRPLDRGVDGIALGQGADGLVAGSDVRQVAPTAEQGLHIRRNSRR